MNRFALFAATILLASPTWSRGPKPHEIPWPGDMQTSAVATSGTLVLPSLMPALAAPCREEEPLADILDPLPATTVTITLKRGHRK